LIVFDEAELAGDAEELHALTKMPIKRAKDSRRVTLFAIAIRISSH
jgi:hypothetical protein